MEERECSLGDLNAKLWKKLWCLHLPTRVKNFGWRACINGLPTMENLFLRGISTNKTCLVCKKNPECIQHALLGCEFTKMVWNHYKTPHWPLTIAGFPSLTLHCTLSQIKLWKTWSFSLPLPGLSSIIGIESSTTKSDFLLSRFGR